MQGLMAKWHTRLVRTLPMIPFYREIMEPEWVQTVGKYMGRERSMKERNRKPMAVQLGELKVGAVVTLNALGDIYDIDTDKKIAGALDEKGAAF